MGRSMPEYHALWYHLGPVGRQDVHLHPRIDREGTHDVLVGFGRDCRPKAAHVRKTLTLVAKWRDRDQEGQPLEGPSGATPRRVLP